MANKYGPNWRAEHPNFDASIIYECVGRMPHGKLGIADEAISIAEKEEVKTKKRTAQPHFSVREKRLQRENEEPRKENSVLLEVQRVVRALVAKGGLDYDALAQETAANLAASESDGGLSKENDKVGHDGAEDNNIGERDHSDEDDEDYNYDDEGYSGHEEDRSFEDDYARW
ncbi:hypothetical protein GQ55_8G074900 [Panicum hallii var. hallii]|uniref:Uncharacterized protein n=1 Tax=Panicum hallii var. hallii TaxID=1504633 RepID=A0A2T7CLN4_9POAL|nr:hypothetical protein GQ55_8G074900 [Panicum hallii var. hallii]